MTWRTEKLYRCSECSALARDFLRAQNPFDAERLIFGCPECKAVNTDEMACDWEDCHQAATCGTPTADGYRLTCYEHQPHDE